MKKLLILLLLFLISYISYSQCNGLSNNFSTVTIESNKAIKVTMQLCYNDTVDLLVVMQERKKKDLLEPKWIQNAYMGDYFLSNEFTIIFTADKSEFKIKLLKEERFSDTSNQEYITCYLYYVITKSKFRLVLNKNIDTIEIVGDNEIQVFDLTNKQSVELYQLTHQYYKFRKWK